MAHWPDGTYYESLGDKLKAQGRFLSDLGSGDTVRFEGVLHRIEVVLLGGDIGPMTLRYFTLDCLQSCALEHGCPVPETACTAV